MGFYCAHMGQAFLISTPVWEGTLVFKSDMALKKIIFKANLSFNYNDICAYINTYMETTIAFSTYVAT